MDAQTQVDISKLNDADKNELSQMLANEQQKATMQQSESIVSESLLSKPIRLCLATFQGNNLLMVMI